jgi:hypothetical protein
MVLHFLTGSGGSLCGAASPVDLVQDLDRVTCVSCLRRIDVAAGRTLPSDLDTFRAMLKRAGIEYRSIVSINADLDRTSTFVSFGDGEEALRMRFDDDGRLAGISWFGPDGALKRVGQKGERDG